MATTDTASAKKYASIAEVAAAEAKSYSDTAAKSEDFSNQAKAAADQAQESANNALEANNSASESSANAALAAETAITAAENAVSSANVYPTLQAAQDAINSGEIPDGSIFSVASTNSTSYIDQYKNVGGIPNYLSSLTRESFVKITNEIARNTSDRLQGIRTLNDSSFPIEECDQNGVLIGYFNSQGKKFYPGGVSVPVAEAKNVVFNDGLVMKSSDDDDYFNPEIDMAGHLLWGTKKITAEKIYLGRMLFNNPGDLAGDFSAMGDSITANGAFNGSLKPESWHTWASLFTNGQLILSGIYATAGARVDQIIALHLSSVIAAKNTMCVVMAGRNDIIQGVDIDNVTIPGFITIFRTLLMSGIIPVVCTMSAQGNSNSASQRTAEHKLNNWLRAYAKKQKLPFVDLHKVTVDPTTGNWLPGYNKIDDNGNPDPSHPSALGAMVMGSALSDALSKWTSPTLPEMVEEQIASGLTNNILTNSLFYNLNSGGNAPNDFAAVTTGTTSITTDPSVKGNVWKINSGKYTKSVTLVPGTKMAFAFYVKSSSDTQFECYLASGGVTSTNYLTGLRTWNKSIQDLHYFYGEFTVPSGVTTGTIVVSSGLVDLSVAQMGLFNQVAA
jgi:lysophospholipase L1-like esterase